jgi:hypothetical protein
VGKVHAGITSVVIDNDEHAFRSTEGYAAQRKGTNSGEDTAAGTSGDEEVEHCDAYGASTLHRHLSPQQWKTWLSTPEKTKREYVGG